jgi:hypothetical protein
LSLRENIQATQLDVWVNINFYHVVLFDANGKIAEEARVEESDYQNRRQSLDDAIESATKQLRSAGGSTSGLIPDGAPVEATPRAIQ